MSVNLMEEIMPQASSFMQASATNNENICVKGENQTQTTKLKTTKTEISFNDNKIDDSALIASLPKAEIKLKKLDETKLLMDNNENSLSVDTLIEILSSNTETKLPIIDNMKNKLLGTEENGSSEIININVPPSSIPSSTLNSPSSSSSSKTGFSSPCNNANETLPPSTSSSSSGALSFPQKFPSPHYANGGKPMLADLNKKMQQGTRRAKAKPKAVYQSQISDNSVGIKLRIKKSIDTFKTLPSPNNNKSPRKRSRKSKSTSSKGCESDSDDSYVKKRKKPSTMNNNNNTNKVLFEEPVEQSGWGKLIPKEVLFEVSRFDFLFSLCFVPHYNFLFVRLLYFCLLSMSLFFSIVL